jgi:hypothetical protein
MPFSFLWVFGACVWFCCDDKVEPARTDLPSFSARATASEEAERCPITAAALRGLLPERSRIDPHTNTDSSIPQTLFPEDSDYCWRSAPVKAYSLWDPPPRTCRVLLI